jgi:hypothetical protein
MPDVILDNPEGPLYMPNVAYHWSPYPRHFKTGRGGTVNREKNGGLRSHSLGWHHVTMMAPESLCDTCNVVITRNNARKKSPLLTHKLQVAHYTCICHPLLHAMALTRQRMFTATSLWLTRSQETQVVGRRYYTSYSVITEVN